MAITKKFEDRSCGSTLCDKDFTPKTQTQIYCSHKCSTIERRYKKRQVCCSHCGRTFMTKDKGKNFCSPQCSTLSNLSRIKL